jgi:hypothetical protein
VQTACGRIDKIVWFWRGRTAYHANCPTCMIALLQRPPRRRRRTHDTDTTDRGPGFLRLLQG